MKKEDPVKLHIIFRRVYEPPNAIVVMHQFNAAGIGERTAGGIFTALNHSLKNYSLSFHVVSLTSSTCSIL